jgi:hypothetical protein
LWLFDPHDPADAQQSALALQEEHIPLANPAVVRDELVIVVHPAQHVPVILIT